jgi:hypothetical protein
MADPPPPRRDDAPASASRAAPSGQAGAQALVETLVRAYREQMRRALGSELDDSVTALAFVDHHLSTARDEDREPILSLLASAAGAYYGEIVREHIGGTWVGDDKNPRRLRLLLEPQFVFFSPIDQAYEAILGCEIAPDDPRVPADPPFDSIFHLQPSQDAEDDEDHEDDLPDDAQWLRERLAERPPLPEDQFYSLTCRFETLQLMLELLATKHASEGRPPRMLAITDYLHALA